MTAYEFGLTFAIPEETDLDALIERLGDAGCDDATVGVGRRGRVALSFTREAGSAAEAVFSAIGAVRRAISGARLVEASPDLIGLTDVAALLGVTRQNARKLLLGCATPAPPPVHEGRPTLWRLAKVSAMAARSQGLPCRRRPRRAGGDDHAGQPCGRSGRRRALCAAQDHRAAHLRAFAAGSEAGGGGGVRMRTLTTGRPTPILRAEVGNCVAGPGLTIWGARPSRSPGSCHLAAAACSPRSSSPREVACRPRTGRSATPPGPPSSSPALPDPLP